MALDESEASSVNKVIAEFCSDVIREPLSYFSEADLQSALFSRLTSVFGDQIETSVLRGPKSKGRYRTSRVHREYGAEDGRRTDILILPRNKVSEIDSPNLTVRGEYVLPQFAIELGTEKGGDVRLHVANDLLKLQRATERGYLLHFYRDITVSDVGTTRRTMADARIVRCFKAPVMELRPSGSISYLCFLIQIARKGTKIRGKCQMLDVSTGKWTAVNLRNVFNEVMKALSTPANFLLTQQ